MNDETTIFFSKKTILKDLSLGLVLLTFGMIRLYLPSETLNPAVVMILGIGLILLAILLLLQPIDRFLLRKPGIKLNSTGISGYLIGEKIGTISWSDITKVDLNPFMKNVDFIHIHLKNPEYYISLETSSREKKVRRSYLDLSGTPIKFSADPLTIKNEKLLRVINQYLIRYQ